MKEVLPLLSSLFNVAVLCNDFGETFFGHPFQVNNILGEKFYPLLHNMH